MTVEEKVVDSLEFLLPSLVALKEKYQNDKMKSSAIHAVIFAIATLCYLLNV